MTARAPAGMSVWVLIMGMSANWAALFHICGCCRPCKREASFMGDVLVVFNLSALHRDDCPVAPIRAWLRSAMLLILTSTAGEVLIMLGDSSPDRKSTRLNSIH